MLILTRRNQESIIIDGDIEVKVLGINDGYVRLGITAPEDVPVHRQEIQEKIDRGDNNGQA